MTTARVLYDITDPTGDEPYFLIPANTIVEVVPNDDCLFADVIQICYQGVTVPVADDEIEFVK